MSRLNRFVNENRTQIFWWSVIGLLISIISILHYTTPTMKWQFHLLYMQSYFIPILIGAFQFGIRGGLGVAVVISLIYFPHIMLQWGGMVENNLMRFLQIALFNVIGYLTGIKTQKENEEKARTQQALKELEESLLQLRKQSEKLSDLEEQLRLADRLSIIGELTASLAHEVRNPLGAIRGTVEILRDEFSDQLKETDFFRILIEETERLNSVVDNYLSFARKKDQEESQYNIREVVQNSTLLLSSKARKSGIQFKIDLPQAPIILEGDPNNLRQSLVNLELNAIQAMNNGGEISITGQLVDGNHSSLKQKILRLTINDQGSGIKTDDLEEIFKPFFTTKADGTGLGLSIVKRIADENHWRIDVSSKSGSGTTFTLLIPVNEKTSADSQAQFSNQKNSIHN
jgi:signal transduction histidine kinase